MFKATARTTQKTVGVIGGMGPEATVDFMRRVILATPVTSESDHLHVLVDNNPKVPSRIGYIIEGVGEDPAPSLCAMAQGLEAQGADFLVMPCNTAHHFASAIAGSVQIPLLNMVALSAAKLAAMSPRPLRVGILASPAVRLVAVYDQELTAAGFQPIFPDPGADAALLDIIVAVKTATLTPRHRQDYSRIAKGLIDAGAEVFLMACTELSVIGPPEHAPLPYVDALDALVAETVSFAQISKGVPSRP